MTQTIERARHHVARMHPAIQGEGGDAQTFKVAVVLVKGFNLSEKEAWPILCDYNSRCEPSWSEKELHHKLHSAMNLPPASLSSDPMIGISRGRKRQLRPPKLIGIPGLFTKSDPPSNLPPRIHGTVISRR